MRRVKRYSLLLIVAIIAVLISATVIQRGRDPLYSPARRAWSADAIATIGRHFDDKAWVTSETGKLPRGNWFNDELIVAGNGDWIICRSVAAKEQNTPVKKDLFVGRGSDGRWYYSTFHFCVGKCVLQMERQPESLAEFVDAYSLVPFDGAPDHCLAVTWDGGAYGDGKLQARSTATSRESK